MNAIAYILSLLIILSYFVLQTTSPVYASSIVINEIMPKSDEESEWVELYNPTTETISIENWIIKDDNSSTSDDIKLTGSLNASEIKTFERSKGWLNDGGDTVSLIDQNGTVIDSHTYGTASTNKSIGRVPDNSTWQDNLYPTKSLTNNQTTPTPTSSVTANENTSQSQSLIISNIPTNIKSTDSFSINVTLTSNTNINTSFFIKGAFYRDGETNYFGKTKVSNSWIKNSQSATEQFKIITDSSGNWSGNLELMVDSDDSGYKGSGGYKIKVARYNSDGSGLFWSNDVSINIENISPPTQTSSNKQTATPKSAATTTPSDKTNPPSSTSANINSKTDDTNEYKTPVLSSDDPSKVLGASSISTAKIKTHKVRNWFFILAGVIILISGGIICYKLYLHKKTNYGI